jgi:hypothetical protein
MDHAVFAFRRLTISSIPIRESSSWRESETCDYIGAPQIRQPPSVFTPRYACIIKDVSMGVEAIEVSSHRLLRFWSKLNLDTEEFAATQMRAVGLVTLTSNSVQP